MKLLKQYPHPWNLYAVAYFNNVFSNVHEHNGIAAWAQGTDKYRLYGPDIELLSCAYFEVNKVRMLLLSK